MDAANLPHGIVADTNWVHIIAEPGAGTYARRPAPLWPEFTAIERQTNGVILKWSGQGTLQDAQQLTGPWNSISNAASPYLISTGAVRRFFRIIAP